MKISQIPRFMISYLDLFNIGFGIIFIVASASALLLQKLPFFSFLFHALIGVNLVFSIFDTLPIQITKISSIFLYLCLFGILLSANSLYFCEIFELSVILLLREQFVYILFISVIIGLFITIIFYFDSVTIKLNYIIICIYSFFIFGHQVIIVCSNFHLTVAIIQGFFLSFQMYTILSLLNVVVISISYKIHKDKFAKEEELVFVD